MANSLKSRSRARIYTAHDVSLHTSPVNCWVSRKGRVYDVTSFVPDHPGGEDFILRYAGKDLGDAMDDAEEHVHSDSAFTMLDEFCIGKLGTDELIVSEDWEPEEDFHPEDTDTMDDYEKTQFLDLNKPLLAQVWFSNFSKSFYLQQVHQPRHLPYSARMFKWDILEMFTLTPWYVVPMVWLPIAAYLLRLSIMQFTDPTAYNWPSQAVLAASEPKLTWLPPPIKALLCFFGGNFVWTLLEYFFHRFIFHLDSFLPDHPMALTVHFTMHGVHHYLPMDRLRLVMPPALFTALSFPFTRLAYFLFPSAVANGVIAGAFTFYVLYDTMHYALHHSRLPTYVLEMKKYHLAHHYKNFELGFGVTSKIWDYVFGTVLKV
ncbi:oxidoreductase [Dacryopinax primogenitus]|uniref:Ceramide very long chain fatty acid hydroxylase n=1 Tax=Dacryopinax primogenitus (strain DJM 731) TaxID=1858805 RepID=M5FQQ2_DACPD|nr:oxidoreductase [Dacryopinax primogenitus]EJT99255.1 oxidoreductase [Dacryopinax primogenitus]